MSTVRQPRAWVSCAGGLVNVIECEVTLVRGSGTGSTFAATMALDESSNPGAAFWSDTAPLPVSIVATDGSNSDTLINGNVTEVELDLKARVVHIRGLDKTEDFIANRTDKKWENTPISAVVSEIAGYHGVGPFIDGGTDMAGLTYDGQNYTLLSDYESDWDIIQHLAEQAGKIAFIDRDQLFFVNPGEPNFGSYTVTYSPPSAENPEESNTAIELHCRRDIQIGEGVTGQFATWDTRQQQPYNVQTTST